MIDSNEEKRKLLNEVLRSIKEELGENIMLRHKLSVNKDKSPIASDNDKLNDLLKGGFRPGKMLELYGSEGVGKTSFALKLAAKIQAKGGFAAIVDTEHTFDRAYAAKLGIDERSLWVAESYTAEEALMILEKLIRSKLFDIVILDSVAALSPEVEGASEEGDEWLQAQILSQAMRRISKLMRNSNAFVVCVNQLRFRPTTCHFEGETTPGGMTLKFLSDYRLKLMSGENEFVLAKAPKL